MDHIREEALKEDIGRHERMEKFNESCSKQRDEDAMLVQEKLLENSVESTTFMLYMSLAHPQSTVTMKELKMWRALSPLNMAVLLAIREHRNNVAEMYTMSLTDSSGDYPWNRIYSAFQWNPITRFMRDLGVDPKGEREIMDLETRFFNASTTVKMKYVGSNL